MLLDYITNANVKISVTLVMTDERLKINAIWLNDRGGIKINAT